MWIGTDFSIINLALRLYVKKKKLLCIHETQPKVRFVLLRNTNDYNNLWFRAIRTWPDCKKPYKLPIPALQITEFTNLHLENIYYITKKVLISSLALRGEYCRDSLPNRATQQSRAGAMMIRELPSTMQGLCSLWSFLEESPLVFFYVHVHGSHKTENALSSSTLVKF